MTSIELVIKVPEKDWKFLKESNGCRWSKTIIEAVINGTPLPKGHGRLKDVDHYIKMEWEHPDYSLTDDEPTIIEADKESEK